jgi:RHH-type rel operon transcriptional repressor/antitoxin RelB
MRLEANTKAPTLADSGRRAEYVTERTVGQCHGLARRSLQCCAPHPCVLPDVQRRQSTLASQRDGRVLHRDEFPQQAGEFPQGATEAAGEHCDEGVALTLRRRGVHDDHTARACCQLQCTQQRTASQNMSTTMTIRLDDDVKERLDVLAGATRRSKSFLAAEAIKAYVENNEWQIAEIEVALKEADAGDFATDKELAGLARKWKLNAR